MKKITGFLTEWWRIIVLSCIYIASIWSIAHQQNSKSNHCQPSDSVCVWVDSKSHVYHSEGCRSFGETDEGYYINEEDAKKGGNRLDATEASAEPFGYPHEHDGR